ncbi:hypothetical protein PtrSN002B_012170 [Pyrenophora tritici-repentis]|nr:hypothetical protein PtrSN002B_012170 [Pyrenophora tritici-repentis]
MPNGTANMAESLMPKSHRSDRIQLAVLPGPEMSGTGTQRAHSGTAASSPERPIPQPKVCPQRHRTKVNQRSYYARPSPAVPFHGKETVVFLYTSDAPRPHPRWVGQEEETVPLAKDAFGRPKFNCNAPVGYSVHSSPSAAVSAHAAGSRHGGTSRNGIQA